MDGLQEILFTLRQNKLRTALTAFGVFWGILMLVLLLGAGRGMQKGMSEGRFNDMNDCIWIFPNITSMPYKGFGVGREVEFTEADMVAIRQQIPDVRYMSSENSLGNFINPDTLVSYGLKSGTFNVLGVGDEYFNIKEKVKFNDGRRFDPYDTEDNRKVAVIGTRVGEKLFSSGDSAIGKQIQINGIAFRVVGLFYDKGNRGVMSERVYIPVSTFKKTFGGGEKVSLIVVRPHANIDGIELENKIVALLKQRHNIAPEDTRALEISNVGRDTLELKSVFNGVTAFIWIVGIGTLFAGVVGVSNIMIITVKERTREIGIRKALGANPHSIVGSLLLESVMVTSVAGYAGLIFGVIILEVISTTLTRLKLELAYFQNPEVDLAVALSALLLLVVAGVVAGLVPALRAARIMPIEAMRAE
jgi:putative ABC transport system permease protein